ncbi:MAG: molybdenum cofactor biosysynthesis protein [Opitutaceae bacterium]|jgi:MOSC domain-containing protein YiiM
MFRIEHLFLSSGHNYFGHHGQPAGQSPTTEVDSVECVAGRGLRGDRFFDYKEDYKGQITFFSGEVYDELCAALFPASAFRPPPSETRRNVITRGIDLNTLIGKTFELQGVRFEGVSECSPCYWMDQAFAPGANDFLKGRGGLRAKILTDGWLHKVTRQA